MIIRIMLIITIILTLRLIWCSLYARQTSTPQKSSWIFSGKIWDLRALGLDSFEIRISWSLSELWGFMALGLGIFTGIVQRTFSGISQWNFAFVTSGVTSFALTAVARRGREDVLAEQVARRLLHHYHYHYYHHYHYHYHYHDYDYEYLFTTSKYLFTRAYIYIYTHVYIYIYIYIVCPTKAATDFEVCCAVCVSWFVVLHDQVAWFNLQKPPFVFIDCCLLFPYV